MWKIYEHRRLEKILNTIPAEIIKRYEKWKDIVSISGPQALKKFKGFYDEALRGKWKGHRSSRLNLQYRVIYIVKKDTVLVQVEKINAHDYRRK